MKYTRAILELQDAHATPLFKLITFPTESQDKYVRGIWIHNINRQNQHGDNWIPNNDSRICSTHFLDGEPTPCNPYPTINMGHNFSVVTKGEISGSAIKKEKINLS